jgi:anti-anti-sigma factor
MQQSPTIQLERHKKLAVITPSSAVGNALEPALERESRGVLDSLRANPPQGIVMDLSQVDYFGSLFLAFMIRCHTLTRKNGGNLVVAGASERIRDLLRLSALDTLWNSYEDQDEALRTLAAPA